MKKILGEADSLLAVQEIHLSLRNLKVHYRVHNSTPLVPVLSQMNPAHALVRHFLRSHFCYPSMLVECRIFSE
jgi:hypothetical protein